MRINNEPPGLLARRFYPVDATPGQWIMEEHWDISVPGCPMIKSPFHPAFEGTRFVRQLVLSQAEFDRFQQKGQAL